MKIGCDCQSYNTPSEGGDRPEIVIQQPPGWYPNRPGGVPVDACMAHVIIHLWARGIGTGSCCCGHGNDRPSIVVSHAEDAHRAALAVAEVDDRRILILGWVLAQLACPPTCEGT